MTTALAASTRDAIITVNKNFMEIFQKADAASLALLYTEDAQLMPTHSDFITTKQGIEQFWQGVFAMGVSNIKIDTIEVEDHGDTAIEVGKYTLSNRESTVMDFGKYIVIWKKEDGQWRLSQDIWNSSVPQE